MATIDQQNDAYEKAIELFKHGQSWNDVVYYLRQDGISPLDASQIATRAKDVLETIMISREVQDNFDKYKLLQKQKLVPGKSLKELIFGLGIRTALIIVMVIFLLITSYSYEPNWYSSLDEEDSKGVFTLLRFLSFVCFSILAYRDYKKSDRTISIVWAASALLINPMFPVKLGEMVWHLVDWIWIVFVLGTVIFDIWVNRKRLKSAAQTQGGE